LLGQISDLIGGSFVLHGLMMNCWINIRANSPILDPRLVLKCPTANWWQLASLTICLENPQAALICLSYVDPAVPMAIKKSGRSLKNMGLSFYSPHRDPLTPRLFK
jgi:hypothetical protein